MTDSSLDKMEKREALPAPAEQSRVLLLQNEETETKDISAPPSGLRTEVVEAPGNNGDSVSQPLINISPKAASEENRTSATPDSEEKELTGDEERQFGPFHSTDLEPLSKPNEEKSYAGAALPHTEPNQTPAETGELQPSAFKAETDSSLAEATLTAATKSENDLASDFESQPGEPNSRALEEPSPANTPSSDTPVESLLESSPKLEEDHLVPPSPTGGSETGPQESSQLHSTSSCSLSISDSTSAIPTASDSESHFSSDSEERLSQVGLQVSQEKTQEAAPSSKALGSDEQETVQAPEEVEQSTSAIPTDLQEFENKDLPVLVKNETTESMLPVLVPTPVSSSSPFGIETVLVDGQPIQTRTYEDANGKWYEAHQLLKSITWMPKGTQEKFVRKWIDRQDTQLLAQPAANGAKTTHVNEKGLQELLAKIETVKPNYVKTSSSAVEARQTTPSSQQVDAVLQPSQEKGGQVVVHSSALPPEGTDLAELLVSDEIITTPVIVNASGTWFGSMEIIANTEYAHRRDIGKKLRRVSGEENVRNISYKTQNGERRKLYVNEEGMKRLFSKVGKKLELIAWRQSDSQNATSSVTQKAVPANPDRTNQTESKNGTFATQDFLVAGKRASILIYREDGDTWLCAFDILQAHDYHSSKGSGYLVKKLDPNIRTRILTYVAGTKARTLIHINMEDARKLVKAIAAEKGLKLAPDTILKALPKAPAYVSKPAQFDYETLISPVVSKVPGPYGSAKVTLGGIEISTRTFADKDGTWYNVNDLVIDSGLKTDKGKSVMLRKVNEADIRLLPQLSPTGTRMMNHLSKKGLVSLLPELDKLAAQHFGTRPVEAEKNDTGESLSVATPSQQPIEPTSSSDNARYGTIAIQVDGTVVHARTYQDESGLWITTREILKASKYAHRHNGAQIVGRIAGAENLRKIAQKTAYGERELSHISARGLEKFLKDINGKLVEENSLQRFLNDMRTTTTNQILESEPYTETYFDDMMVNQPSASAPAEAITQEQTSASADKSESPFGLATVQYKGKEVALPTYVDDSGTWYCVYDLLLASGRTTSSARSSTVKKAIKNGEIRLFNRFTASGHRNNFSHVDMEGLKELLTELNGFEVTPHVTMVNAGTPEKEKTNDSFLFPIEQLAAPPRPAPQIPKKRPVFDEGRIGLNAPRPGDNSGVFTTSRVIIDSQTLIVKSYTDNHRTWFATPDMFELVEMFDKEKQKEFLADILDKDDIKFVWQPYKDGLRLQPHVHTAALSILVPALNKVAEKARQPDESSVLSRTPVKLDLPGTSYGKNEDAGWMPARASEVVTQPTGEMPDNINEVSYDNEGMEVNGKAVNVKIINDSAGTWYASYGILSAAGIKGEENRFAFVRNTVLPEHIRPTDLNGRGAEVHVDRVGLSKILEAVGRLPGVRQVPQFPAFAGQPSAWQETPANLTENTQAVSNAPGNSDDLGIEGVLGSTTIDLFGKPITVKTTTHNHSLWYSAVDIIVGFNEIEEAEGKPTLKKGDLSHYVKAVVDGKNIGKLYQTIPNQPGVRLMTHINAEGLDQIKEALVVTRAGGRPSRRSNVSQQPASPVQTPAIQQPVSPAQPAAIQQPVPPIKPAAMQQLASSIQPAAIQPPPAPMSAPVNTPVTMGYPQVAPAYPSAQAIYPTQPNVAFGQASPAGYGKENVYWQNRPFEVRTVVDANGKWYALDDVLEKMGIAKGSPQYNFIGANIRTANFRMFWQSGPMGIQKIYHVDTNGLFEILNTIEFLAQQQQQEAARQEAAFRQEQPAHQEEIHNQAQTTPQKQEEFEPEQPNEPKMRQSVYRRTEVVPFSQRDAAWLKSEETRRGIASYDYHDKKVRFVRDSAGVVYVNQSDMMHYLHRGRFDLSAPFFNPDGFVRVWTPSMKSTFGVIYLSMDNLEQAVARVDNPEAKRFYEWCITVVEPKLRAEPLVPIGL